MLEEVLDFFGDRVRVDDLNEWMNEEKKNKKSATSGRAWLLVRM